MKIATPLLALLLLAAASVRLHAQFYLVDSPGPGSFYASQPSTDIYYPIGHYNLGYEFTTGSSLLSVSALGLLDAEGDGFNYAHDVGLWDASGTLLASVSIPAGLNSLSNGFAFKPVSVLLAANTHYILSAVWNSFATVPPDALRFNPNGSSPALNGGATLVGDRYGDFGNAPGPLVFPSGTDWSSANTGSVSGFTIPPPPGGAGASYIGPNMEFTAVPEPSTYVAGLALLVLTAAHRRQVTLNGRGSPQSRRLPITGRPA